MGPPPRGVGANALRIRADEVFSGALDLDDSAEREAFLEESCAGDPELRRMADRLLAADAKDETLLMSGAGQSGAFLHDLFEELDRQESHPEGTLVDRYRVLHELGRGGMAVVYLAERADGQFQQQVALKRLLRGIETEDQILRFERERRILALVHHPHIAQLLDGGVDGEGRPYFVMEHVDGRPIDRYCDEEKLPVEDRLDLFLQVARAVDYAHRHLVVHRDIKPSNILVTDDGHAKLLDFGIAKPLEGEGPDAIALTRSQERPMTPVFASPEQVRGEAITTASDVYQLGLLFYLMLSGRWPYRQRPNQRKSQGQPGDWIRAICEDEPMPPSVAVDKSGTHELPMTPSPQSPRRIARLRSTQVSRLRRQLSGDLDNIALMALRKEPERRYRSVAQFIDDIESYLAGRPVAARPDTFFYRAGKLVRRHRGAALTALGALLLVMVLGAWHTVRLARERNRAQRAAAEATQVSQFLRGLFEVSAPTRSKGEQVTARQLLDQGARRVDEELRGQPVLQADMMSLMGDVYRQLALYDEALPLLERAVELRRQSPGNGREVAEALHSLARAREDKGEVEQARELYEEALRLRLEILGPEHPEVAETYGGLGRLEELAGNFAAARQHQETALSIAEAALGPDAPQVGRILQDLGRILAAVRQYETARERLERALDILESNLEPDHPDIADARIHLGESLRFTGDPEAAQEQYEAALPHLEKAYGPDHPVLAVALTKLAHLLNAQKNHVDAIERHRQALEIRRKAFGAIHPLVAASLNNLGYAFWNSGEDETARKFLEESVAVYEAALGEDHPDLDRPLRNLAGIFQESGDRTRAVRLYERVLALRTKTYGEAHSKLNPPLHNLAVLKLELGDAAGAEPLLRRALAVGREGMPHRRPEILWPRVTLGRCLTALGHFEEAQSELLSVLEDPDVDERLKGFSLEALIPLQNVWGRPKEAARYRAALEALDSKSR